MVAGSEREQRHHSTNDNRVALYFAEAVGKFSSGSHAKLSLHRTRQTASKLTRQSPPVSDRALLLDWSNRFPRVGSRCGRA